MEPRKVVDSEILSYPRRKASAYNFWFSIAGITVKSVINRFTTLKNGVKYLGHALPVSCIRPDATEYVAYCVAVMADDSIEESFHDCGKCPHLIYHK